MLPTKFHFIWLRWVSEKKIKMWKVNGRWTTSDGKSSHCLWQGELKKKLYKGPSNHYSIAPFGFNQFSNGWKNYLFIFSYWLLHVICPEWLWSLISDWHKKVKLFKEKFNDYSSTFWIQSSFSFRRKIIYSFSQMVLFVNQWWWPWISD